MSSTPGAGAPPETAPVGLAACVERILALPEGAFVGLTESRAVAELGERLATLNLGLARVASPAAFSWPGHWIGVVEAPNGERRAVVLFGVPSGPLEERDAAPLRAGTIVDGFVVAPLDLHRSHGAGAYVSEDAVGTVVAIFTAPAGEAPCAEHRRCVVRAGKGLDGDRYATGTGTFSKPGRGGQDLTLIEAESLEALAGHGVRLSMADARRNVVTRGLDLPALVGRCFTIGGVACYGARLAEPCAHLERLTQPGVLRGLVHRGGIRADVLEDGELRVGDEVRALPDRTPR